MSINSHLNLPKPDSIKTVEVFDEIVVRLFDELYQYFPVPKTIGTIQLAGVADNPSTPEAIWRILIASNSILVLKKEGFLDFSPDTEQNNMIYNDVVLTSKALVGLKKVGPFETKNSNADEIRKILSSARDSMVSSTMSALVTAVLSVAVFK